MKEIFELINRTKMLRDSLQSAVNKYPGHVLQNTNAFIRKKAGEKLKSTQAAYLAAVKLKIEQGGILVVSLKGDSWIANAVENGIDSFNMKRGLLDNPTNKELVKISKKGYKYRSIPLGIDPTRKGGTAKSQEYQQNLSDLLDNHAAVSGKFDDHPAFGNSRAIELGKDQSGRDRGVRETQKFNGADPVMRGLHRFRDFESRQAMDAFKKKGGNAPWKYALFRTVSENPFSETGATWDHPGIKPANILKATSSMLDDKLESMLYDLIKSECNRRGLKI